MSSEGIIIEKNVLDYYMSYLQKNGLATQTDILLVGFPFTRYDGIIHELTKSLPPFGMGILATMADQKGIRIKILDAESMQLTIDEMASIINTMKPKALGLSICSPSVTMARDLLCLVDGSSEVIFAGGPHITVQQGDSLAYLGESVDALFVGDAEYAWDIFLEKFKNNRNRFSKEMFDGIPGVLTKNQRLAKVPIFKELDTLPFIDRKFFINDPYSGQRKGIISAISSSRGCPYNCNYCAANVCRNNILTQRSISNVVDEIEMLSNKGVEYFQFSDDTFTAFPRRIKEFRQEMENRKLNIKWLAFSRSEGINEDSLKDMKASGCYKLFFGIESGCNDILYAMNKRQTVENVRQAVLLCKKFGIKVRGQFMIGYPGETIEQIKTSVNFAIELDLESVAFNIVRAYPGTKLYSDMIDNGYAPDDLLDYVNVNCILDDAQLNDEQFNIKVKLESTGVFNMKKVFRYNVAHRVPICDISTEDLCREMENAYINFYYRNKDAGEI